MLKYRLQGTRNAIKMGMRIILRSEKVEIVSISDLYPEKGSNKYHRVYVDVVKVPKMDERISMKTAKCVNDSLNPRLDSLRENELQVSVSL